MREYLAPAAAGGGQVDAVNGALMLIRRKWFEDLGGFDERYWMYMEDLDLCWRFAERNRLTWFVPEAEAVHVKGASSGRFRPLRLNWAFHSGMIRFYRDHLASEHNPLYNWAIYLGVLIKFSFSALRSAMGRVAGSDGSR
jgi:GT2 family glycosyltransferase